MITLEAALGKLEGVKRSGKGYLALCPTHEDKKQSLKIDEEGGKLLLKCFAGCSFEDIIAALESVGAAQPIQASIPATPAKVVAVYDYQDEQGNVLYQVHRTDRKDFWQKKPNGENIGDTRRVLFRLPEVIKSETVFIVEGEKDVMTMNVLGLTATTVSGGANPTNWKPDFAEYFKDKRVVLLPDHDEPGLRFMQHVAEQLLPVTDKVKLIELPGLHNKEDVTDWIQGGHTKHDLLQLVAKKENLKIENFPLPNFPNAREGESREVKGIVVLSTDDLLEKYKNLPDAEYLPLLGLDSLLVKGWCTLIAGESKAGKTELLIDLCMRTKERVLFITEEAPGVWVKKLRDRGNISIPNLKVAFALGFEIEKILKMVADEVHGVESPEIIILDTTRQLLRMTNENDNAEVSRKVSQVKALVTHELGRTLLLTHHTNKKQDVSAGHEIAGGSAFTGAVDTWLVVKRAKDEPEGSRRREISGRGRDDGDIQPILYEMDENFVFTVLGAPKAVAMVGASERIMNVITDTWQTQTAILESLSDPKPGTETVRSALYELAKFGQILRDPAIKEGKTQGKTAHWRRNPDFVPTSQDFPTLPRQENAQLPNALPPRGVGSGKLDQENSKNTESRAYSEELDYKGTSQRTSQPHSTQLPNVLPRTSQQVEEVNICAEHIWGNPTDGYRLCTTCGQASKENGDVALKEIKEMFGDRANAISL